MNAFIVGTETQPVSKAYEMSKIILELRLNWQLYGRNIFLKESYFFPFLYPNINKAM